MNRHYGAKRLIIGPDSPPCEVQLKNARKKKGDRKDANRQSWRLVR